MMREQWFLRYFRRCAIWKRAFFLFCFLLPVSGMVCGCGYSGEEKQRMREMEQRGGEYAARYVQEKYGFTPEIRKVTVCMERDDRAERPWANGYVLAVVEHAGETFRVHVSGESYTGKGRDDRQRGLIEEEGKAYFEGLLGYGIDDFYLEYGKNRERGSTGFGCHGEGLIEERYEPGRFEAFLQRHPVSLRAGDFADRDLVRFFEEHPGMACQFERWAADCGMGAVLLSYRSRADYGKSCAHSYGRGGALAFDIWNDGMYMNSYAVFDEKGMEAKRFELQELDGMTISCEDQAEGPDLALSRGKCEWTADGEEAGKLLSEVYSVRTKEHTEVVVYIPGELFSQYGAGSSVWIRHFYEGKWRQYEPNLKETADRAHRFFTFYGVDGGNFDFAFLKSGR